jgi:hypothetical protein
MTDEPCELCEGRGWRITRMQAGQIFIERCDTFAQRNGFGGAWYVGEDTLDHEWFGGEYPVMNPDYPTPFVKVWRL